MTSEGSVTPRFSSPVNFQVRPYCTDNKRRRSRMGALMSKSVVVNVDFGSHRWLNLQEQMKSKVGSWLS